MNEKPKVHCPVCDGEHVEPAEKCTDCGQVWYVRLPKSVIPDSVRELCDQIEHLGMDIPEIEPYIAKVRAEYGGE